jgi:hypothetical protein
MADYWPGCGWRLLLTNADGQLVVTDDFLRHLLQRPELAPVPESCAAERALHEALLAQPRQAVEPARLAALADADAAANYAVWLRFRARLLARPTLEGSYLQLFQGDVDVPPLLVHQLTQVLLAELDVLGEANAGQYWDRGEAHDLVVQLNHGQPALAALCEVIERWVGHFLGAPVRVQVAREIDEDQWVWHVGLDAQATAVLNALYRGEDIDEAQGRRMLCLFRLEFVDPQAMRADIAGRPVWLAMAMDEGNRLRLKPQNLLLNLPLARPS